MPDDCFMNGGITEWRCEKQALKRERDLIIII